MSKCIPWIVHTAKYNNLLKTFNSPFWKKKYCSTLNRMF